MDYKDREAHMARIKHANEQRRLELLEEAKDVGVSIVHIFDEDHPFGGLTVAFRKCNSVSKNAVMADVALAYCSPHDNFSRKIGTAHALEKWFDGYTIQMPLFMHEHVDGENALVKSIFSQMFYGY